MTEEKEYRLTWQVNNDLNQTQVDEHNNKANMHDILAKRERLCAEAALIEMNNLEVGRKQAEENKANRKEGADESGTEE